MELSSGRGVSQATFPHESAMNKRLLVMLAVVAFAAVPVFTQSSSSPRFDATTSRSAPARRRACGAACCAAPGTSCVTRRCSTCSHRLRCPCTESHGGPELARMESLRRRRPGAGRDPTRRPERNAEGPARGALRPQGARGSDHDPRVRAQGWSWNAEDESLHRAANCQSQGRPEPSGVPAQHLTCTGTTMAALAEQLPRVAGAYFPGAQPARGRDRPRGRVRF